jgi:protein-tyrosine phosphatase
MTQFLAALLVGGLTMTSLAAAEISNAGCVQTGVDRYRITFQLNHGSRSVEMIASLKPDGSDGKAVGTASHSPYDVTAGSAGERVYFFLKPDKGPVLEVSLRRLPLAGAANFRDLGGYRTKDGRYIRWGQIYRSGELGHLTDADLLYLAPLNIQMICDFRTRQEKLRLPDKMSTNVSGQPGTKRLEAPIGDERGNEAQRLIHEAVAPDAQPEKLRAMMVSAYESMALDGAPRYREALHEIASGRLPFAYHCTAGKDRAGLFSAILLTILGVPRDAIRDDYLLSNEYLLTPPALAQISEAMRATVPGAPPPSPEAVNILAGVDQRYLEAAFSAIDRRYGSFDAYRREALGLSDQDVEAVRRALLRD